MPPLPAITGIYFSFERINRSGKRGMIRFPDLFDFVEEKCAGYNDA